MRRVGGLQEAELLDMLILRAGGTGVAPSVQFDSSWEDISARSDWNSILIPLKFFLFHLSSLKVNKNQQNLQRFTRDISS